MSANRSACTPCCRPANSFLQKYDASWMLWRSMAAALGAQRTHDPPKSKSLTSEVIDWRAQTFDSPCSRSIGAIKGERHDRSQDHRHPLHRSLERADAKPPPRNPGCELDQRRQIGRSADV